MSTGTLYGIGVGPGDPELLTLKAVRILKEVDVVFTASSSKNSFSLAVEIAREHVPEGTEVIVQPFPMTKDKEVMGKAWAENARAIVEVLETGKNAAFLTLGDSLTYSTYGYILQNIQADFPHVNVETVPGITSYQAAASRMNTILVEGEESMVLTSGAYGGEHVRRISDGAENVVLLKAYKNVKDIADALDENGLLADCKAIQKCGREGEAIIDNIYELAERDPDYWTLVIAKKNNGKVG